MNTDRRKALIIAAIIFVVLWISTLFTVVLCCRYEYFYDSETGSVTAVDRLTNERKHVPYSDVN